MKNYSKIIIFLAFLLLGGLVFWQLQHLKISQDLKQKIELHEMQSVLMESAIELRKAKNKDASIRLDSNKKRAIIDSVLKRNFKKFNRDISWGFFDGNGYKIDSLSYTADITVLKSSLLKVCTSCLIMIDVQDNNGNSKLGNQFILDQTPAQMYEISGQDESQLEYLYVYLEPKKLSLKPYILPSIFLMGLLGTLLCLIYLNVEQRKLIKQKNEFVNHLSHEFQTPLSSIKLSANLLAKETEIDKSELIQIIQTESKRLENHIKTVLHWVKSDANHLHVKKEKVRLTDVIENSLKQMKPIFLTHKTKVNFIPSDEELVIDADANHLQLMLFNIWENAIKHNENPIELTIRMSKENGMVQISNADNGKGISDLNSKIKFKGLGLAYVNSIMNEHDGKMILSSTEKGLILNLNFLYNG